MRKILHKTSHALHMFHLQRTAHIELTRGHVKDLLSKDSTCYLYIKSCQVL